MVLLCGLALAILVAILEFCWNSKKNAQSDRVSRTTREFPSLLIISRANEYMRGCICIYRTREAVCAYYIYTSRVWYTRKCYTHNLANNTKLYNYLYVYNNLYLYNVVNIHAYHHDVESYSRIYNTCESTTRVCCCVCRMIEFSSNIYYI